MKLLIVCTIILAPVFGLVRDKGTKVSNNVIPASRPEVRIFNGHVARPGQFPYQADIYWLNDKGEKKRCGGALISHTEVLTTANCIKHGHDVQVSLGPKNAPHMEVSYNVTRKDFFPHPDHVRGKHINDIGIIKIPDTKYSANIQPVNLPTADDASSSFDHETAIFATWGATSASNHHVTNQLHYARLEVIPNSACLGTFSIKPEHVCSSTYGQVSPCTSDLGNPLVLEKRNIVIGIFTAHHVDGCNKNFPAVFVRVAKYLKWINETRESKSGSIITKISTIVGNIWNDDEIWSIFE